MRRRRAVAAGAVVVALMSFRLWPRERVTEQISFSTTVWSADNQLLRVTRTQDDRFRVWVPLEHIAPDLVEAFLLKEDRSFYVNPGVNPIALVRGAVRTYRDGRRQGGSTITMQLARIIYHLNTRTIRGKLEQIACALWLESRYSKHDLLEAYLNVVPFGGNLEGAGAASLIYFGKPADRVTLGEALTLAVVPQRPANRAGGTLSEERPIAARRQLARAWLARHNGEVESQRQAELPILARTRFAMPHEAPHFVDAVLTDRTDHTVRIDTTLDSQMQRVLERQLARYLTQYGDRGIRNSAALLITAARRNGTSRWIS